VAVDEEGRLNIVLGEGVEKLRRVDPRAVVKREGYLSGDGAVEDLNSVRDVAKAGPGNARRVLATGGLVGIAADAKGHTAPRSRTEFGPCPAVTLRQRR